ncbi:MAG TPA: pirin family protein [Gammaproteobacteria bacterium]|nr:pirin family protein [Gammaproteobacteria bacterium]
MATNPKSATKQATNGVREVARKVRGMPTSDGAGVRLTRVIGQPALDSFDPFLLLDELRSDNPDDYIEGFPNHPHRGFETVTYMLAGRMRHGDNQGNSGLLGPGSVQWMTAGKGIVHSEIPEQQDGLMWGFQLWVNLPAKDKLTKPRYQDIQGENVPEVELGPGARARVLVGTVNGVKGPVMEVATDPLYFDLLLEPSASYTATLPEGHNAFAYVYQGDAKVGATGTDIKAQEMALLSRGASLPVTAGDKGARLIVVAGRPLNEPVARYGPFVMNTAEEIHQAFADYQAGLL